MIIKQIYNNNVILSENEAGDEIILVGRGIAFGMTRGSKAVSYTHLYGKDHCPIQVIHGSRKEG